MKQFVFMVMGEAYESEKHNCRFEPGRFISRVETVKDREHAKRAVVQWKNEGVGVIECCGAFSAELVGELQEATSHEIPISRGTHFPQQDDLFNRYFGKGDCAQEGKDASRGDYMMIMMDEGYTPKKDCAVFETKDGRTRIETVCNMEQAKKRFEQLSADGVGLVECCGAFSEENVKELIACTGGKLPIGYVYTEPHLYSKVEAFFYGE